MRKVNTIGIQQANKVMHMAAMAYNLKKYLKFTQKKVKSVAATVGKSIFALKPLLMGLLGAKQVNYGGYACP